MPKAFKYKAFISYSHQDKKWGDWLHKKLETYKVPKILVGTQTPFYKYLPHRLIPTFRDREELASSSELGKQINEALVDSSHLIVICSTRSAKSKWVNQEILQFKRMGKANRILCLIVDGEPNAADKPQLGLKECFPKAIKYKLGTDGLLSDDKAEPIAADARKDKDGKENSLLKLIAGLLGVGYDQLKQRETVRKRNRMFLLNSFLFVLLGIMSTITIWAFSERKESERQKNLAFKSKILAEQARDQAILQKKRAEEANEKTIQENYYNNIFLADLKIKQGDTNGAEKLLWTTRPKDRHWEWGYLLGNADPALLSLKNKGRQVLHLLFSNDGKSLITHEEGGIARVIGLDKNQTIREFPFKGWNWFRTPAFYPRQNLVASLGGGTPQLKIWNYETGETLSEPDTQAQHKHKITAVAFVKIKNMNSLVSADISGKLVFWDPRRGVMGESYQLNDTSINSLHYIRNKKSLFIGDLQGNLQVLEIIDPNSEINLMGKIHLDRNENSTSPILGITTDSNEDRILCWSHNKIWSIDAKTHRIVSRISTYPLNIAKIAFILNHQYAVGYVNGLVEIRSSANNEIFSQTKIHSSGINSLAALPRRNVFASSGKNGDLKICHTEGSLPITQKSYRVNNSGSSARGNADIGKRGNQLMVTLKDRILLFETRTGKVLRNSSDPRSRKGLTLLKASFSPDEKHVISITDDGQVTIHETNSSKVILSLENEKKIKAAVFSPSGKEFLTLSLDKNENLKTWDFPSGILKNAYEFNPNRNRGGLKGGMSISKDGQFISLIGSDGFAKVLAKHDLTLIKQTLLFSKFKSKDTYFCDLNQNGSLACIKTEEDQNSLQLWKIQTGEIERKYYGHSNQVLSSDFSLDSRRIISSSQDSNLKIWHMESGREILSLPNIERMRDAKFCLDDKNILITFDWGGALLLKAYDWEKLERSEYERLKQNRFSEFMEN